MHVRRLAAARVVGRQDLAAGDLDDVDHAPGPGAEIKSARLVEDESVGASFRPGSFNRTRGLVPLPSTMSRIMSCFPPESAVIRCLPSGVKPMPLEPIGSGLSLSTVPSDLFQR